MVAESTPIHLCTEAITPLISTVDARFGKLPAVPQGRDTVNHSPPFPSSSLCLRQVMVLLAITGIAWSGVVAGSFQYDDFANVLTDPATTQLTVLLDRLVGGIRPLTRLSYALSFLIAGEWAGGWLVVNLALHATTVLGIAALVQLRTRHAPAALMAGLIFAIVPSHAFVIAYVSGRSIGLSSCLLVLALLAHEYGITRERRAGLFLSATLFVLACAARETAIVFPLLVLLWEAAREPGRNSSVSAPVCLKRAAPYFVITALMTVLFLMFERYAELLEFSLALRSPSAAALQNLGALPMTLSLLFRPWALSVEHSGEISAMQIVMGAFALALMGGIAAYGYRRQRILTLALLWPVIALLPTHSFIARLDPIGEGSLYLAAIGPAIALGRYAAHWLRGASWRALPATCAGVACLALCIWRTAVWTSPVALWQEATARVPQSSRAWINLGMAQMTRGNAHAARDAFRHSLVLDPANTLALFNLETLAALTPQAAVSSNQPKRMTP